MDIHRGKENPWTITSKAEKLGARKGEDTERTRPTEKKSSELRGSIDIRQRGHYHYEKNQVWLIGRIKLHGGSAVWGTKGGF